MEEIISNTGYVTLSQDSGFYIGCDSCTDAGDVAFHMTGSSEWVDIDTTEDITLRCTRDGSTTSTDSGLSTTWDSPTGYICGTGTTTIATINGEDVCQQEF